MYAISICVAVMRTASDTSNRPSSGPRASTTHAHMLNDSIGHSIVDQREYNFASPSSPAPTRLPTMTELALLRPRKNENVRPSTVRNMLIAARLPAPWRP